MKYFIMFLFILFKSVCIFGQDPYEDCIRAKNDFERQIARLEEQLKNAKKPGGGNTQPKPDCSVEQAKIKKLQAQIKNLENSLKKIKEAHARDITTMLQLRTTKAALDAHIEKLDAEIAQLRSDSSGLADALEGMTTTMKMYMELYTNEVEAKIKATKDFQEQLIKETMVLHTRSRVWGFIGATRGVVLDASNKAGVLASPSQRKEPIYLSFKSSVQGAPRIHNTTYTIKKNGRVLDGAQQIEFSGESDIRLPDALNRNLEANAQFAVEVEYEVDAEKRKIVHYFRVD